MKEKELDYLSLIKNAGLADYGPVHGSIVILPYGLKVWNMIVSELTRILENIGHEQIYFPLLIPESFFDKEKEYIPDLTPSNYTITRIGETKLNMPLVIRPTSELTASYMFSKWINSFRDLPIKVFQWVNIARYEKVTHPFLKCTEIQWLEGHTAHSSHESAIEEIEAITDVFFQFINNTLKIPTIYGEETESKKFVGSLFTRSFETITPNGRALQLAAIYDLGQVFSNLFSVKYRDTDNNEKMCWTTDWGLGFRLIGAMALIHSDSRGLKLPSTIAPYQIRILSLSTKKAKQELIDTKCNEIKQILNDNNIRSQIVYQGHNYFGKLIQESEMAGIPITLLIGDKEIEDNRITLLRRNENCDNNRLSIIIEEIVESISSILEEYDTILYKTAYNSFSSKQLLCDSVEELDSKIDTNWIIAPWCGNPECESNTIELKRNIRILIQDDDFISSKPKCIICKKKAKYKAFFAHNF